MNTGNTSLIMTNSLIIGAFVVYFFGHLLRMLPGDVLGAGIDHFVFTEWLIDYSAGFTRRGLSGELIDLASTWVAPRAFIGGLAWFIFGCVVFGYLRLCARSINTIRPGLLAGVLFLPCLLPFYLYDHAAFGRKEIIGFLILLFHLWALESHGGARPIDRVGVVDFRRYIGKLLVISAALLPIHVLVHESAILLFVPAHAMIAYSKFETCLVGNTRQRVYWVFLIFLPGLLAFSAVSFIGRPSFEAAEAICRKWEIANVLEAGSCDATGKDHLLALPGALTALPWTLGQAYSFPRSIGPKFLLAWLVDLSVFGLATLYVCANVSKTFSATLLDAFGEARPNLARRHSKLMCLKYYLLPIFISTPLYALGCDFGRWFAASCINYAMITLSVEVNRIELSLSRKADASAGFYLEKYRLTGCLLNFASSRLSRFSEWFVLLFLILVLRMPHSCISWAKIFAKPIRSLANIE
jgi:hypothetical protein